MEVYLVQSDGEQDCTGIPLAVFACYEDAEKLLNYLTAKQKKLQQWLRETYSIVSLPYAPPGGVVSLPDYNYYA